MMRLLRKNKGQSTLEYAILIVVVIMALIGVQGYISRAVQGRQRDASDQIGEQFHAGSAWTNITTGTSATINETATAWDTKTIYVNQTSVRSGEEGIGNFSALTWK